MTLTGYQRLAMRTHPNLGASPRDDLALGALGLAGEAGEAVEIVKKHLYHGAELDRDKLTKELGDVLWYVAALAAAAGIDLDVVAEANIAKLRARYPDGFSAEASAARADERPAARVAADVLSEREKQRSRWSEAHDDEHDEGELSDAAACLAGPGFSGPRPHWVGYIFEKHAGDRYAQLRIAAALILAEMERLDRAGEVNRG